MPSENDRDHVVGTLLIVWEEVDGRTDEEIHSYYGDNGDRTREGIGAFLSATATEIDVSDKFAVDPNLARFAVGTGYLFLIGSVFVNCVLIAATSVLALRTDVFPRWLGWVGFAAIVLVIVEVFLLPVFTVPIWVIVVSIVMIQSAPSRDPQARHEESPNLPSMRPPPTRLPSRAPQRGTDLVRALRSWPVDS